MSDFEESLARLNKAQREAVEYIDGPLIVIAGPGTGKTQLLSLRAANILRNRDVQPQNILCLTYTSAGAQNMTERLIELVGKDGYGIEVSTFHSFATSCKKRYPEYFLEGAQTTVVSELHKREILDSLIKELPLDGPLSSIGKGGVSSNIDAVSQFISNLKRQGVSPDEFRLIMDQNFKTVDYLENNTEILDMINAGVPGKKTEKEAYMQRFEEAVMVAHSLAPQELRANVLGVSGIYKPYLTWLSDYVAATELIEGNKTDGFQDVRKAICSKETGRDYEFSLAVISDKGHIAADLYEAYQARLKEEALHDFDDMIMDFIVAVQNNPKLRYALQEQYSYIQVDEFQDTNGAQMRIVELLCEGIASPNVMVVGDDDQAIMRFQGASIACINQFKSRFAPHSIVLKTNYRSTPEIVGLGQLVAKQVEFRLPESVLDKCISAFRPSGEQLTFHDKEFKTHELELQYLAQDIRRRIDEGFIAGAKDPDKAIAVISKKHDNLKALIPYLNAQNIPFSYVQKASIFSMESMQTTLSLLRFVVAAAAGDESAAQSYLPQIVSAPEFKGNNPSSVKFAITAKSQYKSDWMKALAETDNPRLIDLYANLMDWSANAASAPVRELIYKMIAEPRRYYAARAQEDPYAFAEFNSGIRALLDFAEAEMGTAAALGRTLKLPDIIDRLDGAEKFEVDIDAAISIGTPGAVNLVTAHSSKGLEFNLVYLLDAEQKAWHDGNSRGTNLYASNLLIGNQKDEDDARRLLFVAITRARDYLEIYRVGGSTLCELSEDIDTRVVDVNPDELAVALETSWVDSFKFDTPELRALLLQSLPPKSLSASALNLFVLYSEEEELGAQRFPREKVLKLPDAPSISLDFGNIVHEYLEKYVTSVVMAGNDNAAQLAAYYRKQVNDMDFAPDEIRRYLFKFDKIVEKFGPWFENHTYANRMVTEAELSAYTEDLVPLYGYSDLLFIDDVHKTICVVDYKTGTNIPKGKPDRAYQRQLQFYRLLIESCPDYQGYRVESCENWYVEPEKETGELHVPITSSVTDDDIDYLTTLVNAVWHRLERGLYDTSDFETSSEKAFVLAELDSGEKPPTKAARVRALQIAYEAWLIAQDEAICKTTKFADR